MLFRSLQLQLRRLGADAVACPGMLYEKRPDGTLLLRCYTLERAAEGKGRIPAGSYAVDITFSPKFNKPMPEILNVPGFEGVRIHPGNTVEDTEGCILVGETYASDTLSSSVLAFDPLFAMLREARAKGQISLFIQESADGKQDDERQGQVQGGSDARGPVDQGRDAQGRQGNA